jgi:nucleoside-diphosphate kinase
MSKPFFPMLKAYMMRTPIVAIASEWVNAVAIGRMLTWATNPQEALPWTIRWDFGLTIDWNIIHASDTPENALIELKRFFGWKDIFDYSKVIDEVL